MIVTGVVVGCVEMLEVSSRRKGDVSLGLCVGATRSSFVFSLLMVASIAANASTAEDTDTDDEDNSDDDGSIVVGPSVVCCSVVLSLLFGSDERIQHPVLEHFETTVLECRFC